MNKSTEHDVSRLERERDDAKRALNNQWKHQDEFDLSWWREYDIALTDIHVPADRRRVDESTVANIADDIKRNGFWGHIIVRKAAEGECDKPYVLLDGAHRLEAAKRAKLKAIPAQLPPPGADASIIEHSANLFRKELSEAERKVALAKYKESWEVHKKRLAEEQAERKRKRDAELAELDVKYGKKIGWHRRRLEKQNNDAPCAETPKPRGRPEGFASHAAALTRVSKSQVNRDVADGEKIKEMIEAGAAATADEALEKIKTEKATSNVVSLPVTPSRDDCEPDEAPALRRLRQAWDAAPSEIRRAFMVEIASTPEAREAMQ